MELTLRISVAEKLTYIHMTLCPYEEPNSDQSEQGKGQGNLAHPTPHEERHVMRRHSSTAPTWLSGISPAFRRLFSAYYF